MNKSLLIVSLSMASSISPKISTNAEYVIHDFANNDFILFEYDDSFEIYDQ